LILQSKEIYPVAKKIDSDELANIKELLIACSIQVDTAVKLLIEKGFFTEAEFFTKLKKVQANYLGDGKE
jgi:hypothetical protein